MSSLQVALGILSALGVFGQAGYLAVRVVVPRRVVTRAETVALSYGLGVGLVTFEMLVLSMARVRLSIPALLVPWVLAWPIAWAARGASWRTPTEVAPPVKAPTRTSLVCALLIAGLAVLIGLLLYRSTFYPIYLWDAVAYWDLKARAFFLDRGILPFVSDRYYSWAHLDYPQLVPLAGTVLYLFLGGPHEAVQVVPIAFFAALLVQFHAVLRRETSFRSPALVLTAGLAVLPNLLFWAHNFQGESALAYYAFTTAAYFYLFLRSGQRAHLVLSALSGAFLTQTKIEGPFLLLPACIVLTAAALRARWARQPRRNLGLFLTVTGIVVLPWSVFYRVVGVPSAGFLSTSMVSALGEHVASVPRLLGILANWVWTASPIGAIGLMVLCACLAVQVRVASLDAARRFLLAFLGFALVPYLLLWTALPRYVEEPTVIRFFLVFTVTAYFIVSVLLTEAVSRIGGFSVRDAVFATAAFLVGLLLTHWVFPGHGPGPGRKWRFPESASTWRARTGCSLKTAGEYLKVQPIAKEPCVVDIVQLRFDSNDVDNVAFVVSGPSGTESALSLSWRTTGERDFQSDRQPPARVIWSGHDQRIEITPQWQGVLKRLRITLVNAVPSYSPLFIRSVEVSPRLRSTLAHVVKDAEARSVVAFALAALFLFALAAPFLFAVARAPLDRLVVRVALVWVALAVLAWFLPDLRGGTPSAQLSRPFSLARATWRLARVYPPASAMERMALIESEHHGVDLGASLVGLMEACPRGDLALYVDPWNDHETDPDRAREAVESVHGVLCSAYRFYPYRAVVVTQPTKLSRLLATGVVTRALSYRRELPGDVTGPPNRLLHRGLWSAACGPSRTASPSRVRFSPKANRPPTRVSPGVFDPSQGTWTLLKTRPNGLGTTIDFAYGARGDTPVIGDWDGDSIDTVGVYRPADSRFLLRNSNRPGPPDVQIRFGRPGDVPISGDWDGDGLDNIGVFRPSEGAFFLGSNAGDPNVRVLRVLHFGAAGDRPIHGDWNGDGIDEIGYYHPETATFHLVASNAPEERNVTTVTFGQAGDTPLAGDWDGDGLDTVGVYRPSQRLFCLARSNTSGALTIQSITFGPASGLSLSGAWQGSPWFALE